MTTDGVAIYVLVDALGWEIVRQSRFLDDILVERHRLETILGYSSGAIPTLLTGSYPNVHGHWNLFYHSPETSPFRWTAPLAWLPRTVREGRVVRRAVKEISRRLSGYRGYFAIYNLPLDRLPYYDICETTDIYQPKGLAPARSLFDHLEAAQIPYECYNYHRHTDEQILELVPRRLRESNCRVFFLYLSAFDAFLHFHVSDRDAVAKRLAWYEERLRTIYETAKRRWGTARLYICSDHGMTPIRATENLIPSVERLGLTIGADYLPAYDSTMARFWLFSERARTRLTEFLGRLTCGRLLSDAERKGLGIAFDDRRYGDLVFVMNPGVLICPSDMGRIRFDGMHGFHPREDPSAYAVLLATHPITTPVTHIADVLGVILADVGIRDLVS